MKLNTLLLALLFLVFSNVAFGQSISIYDIDTTNFPTMKAKFYAFDKDRKQVRPSASELSINEDGVPRTITNVSCPPPKPPIALSSVLVIDVSGSMGGGNINLAKTAANAWVNGLPLGKSECVISTFNQFNYLNQDFTTKKDKLTNAINNLNANGGTNYDAALITPIAGGLQISKKGKFKKVIVMLTDGQAAMPQTQAIINEANNQNCVIYCVTLGIQAPQTLIDISKNTGGQVFENITTTNEVEDIYRKILTISQGSEPCEITWESGEQCLNEKTILNLNWDNKKVISYFNKPVEAIINLEINPSFISFGKISNPEIRDTTITLKAINSDIKINDIKLKYGSFIFEIINATFPIIIPINSSKTITLRCTPIDSSMNYASFEIETDMCSFYFSANGGYPGKKMKTQTLKLIHPNGGEVFVAGSDTIITWEGISPTDNCQLEFSNDSGKTWKYLTKTASKLKYLWNNIPSPSSNECLVKISQINKLINDSTINLKHTLIGHKAYNYCVTYSADGKTIASSSGDSTIKIWNVETGQLIRTIKASEGAVYYASFSPDGKTIATTSKLDIKLWDIDTGQLIQVLSGHKQLVYSVSYSPDGKSIVSSSWDKSIILWDAISGNVIKTLLGHTDGVNTAKFSPDGNTIASTSFDYTIKLWDVITGNLLKTMSDHTFYVYDVAFSPDGKILASASADHSIKLWDVNTGQLLKTLLGHNSFVESVSFHPDGLTLASGDQNKTIKVWDIIEGKLLLSLIGHNSFVKCVAFSPDGSSIASTGYDRTVKIWDLNLSSLQSDQSDVVFSIVAPTPSSRDVDMKECLVGVSKDSLVSEFVSNKGNYPYRVDSVYFTGADASAFRQVSVFPKFIVDKNSSKTVELRFNPSRVGLHQAKVHIITQTDTFIQNITGIGIQPTIQIVNDLIDFGYIDVGSPKDTLQVVTIKNVSNVDIDIKNTYHSGPNDKDFSTVKGGGAFKLKAYETAKLDMRFLPTSVGRTSGTLMFEYDGVGSPAVVQLFGEGVGGGQATLKLDTIETKTSAIVEYPIKLTLDSKVLKSGAIAVNFDISYNNTLLYPIGNYPITNKDGYATLKFTNVPLTTDPIQILDTLKFRTGLGNAIETPLTINNFELVGTTEDIEVEPFDGLLKLIDVCYDGGVRLLNPNSVVSMARISPNPVNSIISIDLNLIEIGNTEVSIYNLLGEKVKSIFSKEITETGNITINSEISDLSNGQYVVVFTTPTYTEKSNILVIK